MSDFKIDKNIPYPDRGNPGTSKYPFKNMKVGESFFVGCTEDIEKIRSKLGGPCNYAFLHGIGKFSVRKWEGGFRIWRLK